MNPFQPPTPQESQDDIEREAYHRIEQFYRSRPEVIKAQKLRAILAVIAALFASLCFLLLLGHLKFRLTSDLFVMSLFPLPTLVLLLLRKPLWPYLSPYQLFQSWGAGCFVAYFAFPFLLQLLSQIVGWNIWP